MESKFTERSQNFFMPATYNIRVEGFLDEILSERLAGMTIRTVNRKSRLPVTTLKGSLTDQAELLGVLNVLYNLHMTLIAVERQHAP